MMRALCLMLVCLMLLAGCRAADVPQGLAPTEQSTPAQTAQRTDREQPTDEVPKETAEQTTEQAPVAIPSNKRPYFQLGSNAQLEGSIKVHLFFMDDGESQWSKSDMDEMLDKQVKLGLDYLESAAKQYGKQLELTLKCYATVLDEGYELCYEGRVNKGMNHTMDTLDQAARDLGYADKETMYQAFYRQNDFAEVIFITFFNKDGISFARQQADGSFYEAMVEYVTMFRTYYNYDYTVDDNTHPAASVAHEILHLYGAQDLYKTEYRQELARDICPDEIMMMDEWNIHQMRVTEVTAYAVGWIQKAPNIYFDPMYWKK